MARKISIYSRPRSTAQVYGPRNWDDPGRLDQVKTRGDSATPPDAWTTHLNHWQAKPHSLGPADDWAFCATWANECAQPDNPIILPSPMTAQAHAKWLDDMGGLEELMTDELRSIGYHTAPLYRHLSKGIALCQGPALAFCALIDPWANTVLHRSASGKILNIPLRQADIQQTWQHPNLEQI